MKDLENLEDIKQMVDSFYAKVQEDDLLEPIFNGIIKDNWPKHLEKMYRFWQTVLLEDHTYYGSPFPPHAYMPIAKEEFDSWVTLFEKNIHEQFKGPKADESIWRAKKMAEMFMMKIDHIRNSNSRPIV